MSKETGNQIPLALEVAFDEIIEDQRANHHIKHHPTSYEELVNIFKLHTDEFVPIDDFLHLFESNSDPRTAAMVRISKLNKKLNDHEFHIISTRNLGYRIISLNSIPS